jgi:glucoamylase
MSDQPMYRWLEQQGEAFGAPGLEPRWTSSVKDAVVTAYSGSSRIWFTCSHGVLNEVYYPTIDHAQVRDMEFLLTDGETFAHEEKRDMPTSFETIDTNALGVRYVNRDPDGRYSLTKEMICDPHHGVVLQRVRLEAHADLMPRLKLYALLAPHLDGGELRVHADELRVCGRERRLAGPDAEHEDELGVWVGYERKCSGDGGDRPGMRRRLEERAGRRCRRGCGEG